MIKKILGIVVLGLLVSCSPSPQKIIPKEGIFTEPNKRYLMFCTVEFQGKNSSSFQDYTFAFINGKILFFQIEDWKPYPAESLTVYSSSSSHIDFGLKNDEDSFYVFDKVEGVISANQWSHGGCWDENGGWTYVMEENILIYTRPYIKSPNLFERTKFRINKVLNKFL